MSSFFAFFWKCNKLNDETQQNKTRTQQCFLNILYTTSIAVIFVCLQSAFVVPSETQIPAFHVPCFTDSAFSCSLFYRFRLFMQRVFSFLVPFLVPFSDSPFLVLQIAFSFLWDWCTQEQHTQGTSYTAE